MIGKKVTAYFGFNGKVEKVLHEDKDGLFIRFKGQRVFCRPDTITLNILRFIALDPKIVKRRFNGLFSFTPDNIIPYMGKILIAIRC